MTGFSVKDETKDEPKLFLCARTIVEGSIGDEESTNCDSDQQQELEEPKPVPVNTKHILLLAYNVGQ